MRALFLIIFFIIILLYITIIFSLIFIKKNQTKKIVLKPSPTVVPTNPPTIIPTPPTSFPPLTPTPSNIKKIYVRPDGNDDSNGKTEATALRTIQKAVDLAQPGDIIELMPGIYFQDVVTKRDGLPNSPIIITGQKTAIVKGAKNARVIEINHSYITLDGFSVDGQHNTSYKKSSFRDKLIYVVSKIPKKGITNVKILNMEIKNAGGECVRLRYFAQHNEVAYNTISRCGLFDFEFDDGGKNGEGVYIGTAPEQTDDGRNPTDDLDQSNNNWVHHNTIDTQGNECVDIKEGSSLNVVEYNNCTRQKDTESAGLDSRGDNNIFRYNYVYNNIGAGVRLGGDQKNDGINNQVYENTIVNNQSGGIKIQRIPQGAICGNNMEGNTGGNAVGTYRSKFSPETPC